MDSVLVFERFVLMRHREIKPFVRIALKRPVCAIFDGEDNEPFPTYRIRILYYCSSGL